MMKKSIFFAAAFAGVLCSCSQDEVNEGGGAVLDGRVPIQIGVSQPSVSVSRGIGTVGGTEESGANVWQGQQFKVSMFEKGTYQPAVDEEDNQLFMNADFDAPVGYDNDYATASVQTGNKYYPTEGEFDFVGYYLDGAEQDAVPAPTEEGPYTVNVTIDGSQDIMTASAVPTEEDLLLPPYDGVDVTRLFSAYSARQGVVPVLNFQHKLVRLVFNAKPGNVNASSTAELGGDEYGVQIKSISIESQNTGVLTVAQLDEKGHVVPGKLEFSGDSVPLSLKQRQAGDDLGTMELVDLTPAVLHWDSEAAEGEGAGILEQVGEALLVQELKGEGEAYKMTIVLNQLMPGEQTPREFTMTKDVRLPEGQSFKAGSSYNVNITVWGLEQISIKASLTAWEEGGNIDLDPFNDSEEPAVEPEP